jgi:hypothetical protein
MLQEPCNYIQSDIVKFLKNVKHLLDSSIRINIYKGVTQCMARVWEIEGVKDPNINKRCRNKCPSGHDLCNKHSELESKKHSSKLRWNGRVTERPPPALFVNYSKRNKFDKSIDFERKLNNDLVLEGHNIYKSSQELMVCIISKPKKRLNLKLKLSVYRNKNKILYNSTMEEEQINNIDNEYKQSFEESLGLYDVTLSTFHAKLNQTVSRIDTSFINNDEIKEIAKQCLCKVDIDMPTLRQYNYVTKEVEKAIKEFSMSYDETYQSNKLQSIKEDIYSLESIRFIDNDLNAHDIYYTSIDGESYLFNKNSNKVGILRNWIDDCDEIPVEFKTTDNIVLNPLNKLPVYEIEITVKGSGFIPILAGIYREYEYIEDIEVFRSTGHIIRN